jgi:hypothetical protein
MPDNLAHIFLAIATSVEGLANLGSSPSFGQKGGVANDQSK